MQRFVGVRHVFHVPSASSHLPWVHVEPWRGSLVCLMVVTRPQVGELHGAHRVGWARGERAATAAGTRAEARALVCDVGRDVARVAAVLIACLPGSLRLALVPVCPGAPCHLCSGLQQRPG